MRRGRQTRHRESPMPAHVDAFEGSQIKRYVERQSVIARTAANAQAELASLAAPI
jgi:hypothetical protein